MQPSPSGQRVFVIRKHDPRKKGKADETPTYSVEVVSAQGQLISSASSLGVHGKALAGGSFGGVSWSAHEDYVMFVAEPVADKSDAKNGSGGGEAKEKEGKPAKEKKQEWEHEADWGEQFVGIKSPRAFVFNIKVRFCPFIARSLLKRCGVCMLVGAVHRHAEGRARGLVARSGNAR
jgi:hypothetical protein